MIVTSINIEYVTTSAHNDRLIEKIGGTHPDGTRWKLSAERAIKAIETGEWEFHVIVRGIKKKVVVGRRKNTRFLTIAADPDSPDSLLWLPGFPPALQFM